MKLKYIAGVIVGALASGSTLAVVQSTDTGLYSIETGKTITKVRSGALNDGAAIITNSYEGTVTAFSFDGSLLWENALSGFMNHDVWVDDITGDGVDEVLTANADGSVYCINSDGTTRWTFNLNEVPMNSVTVVSKDDTTYVVAGGYDKNLYYLSTTGELVKTIASSTYSQQKTFGGDVVPDSFTHTVNFVRSIKRSDGSEKLVVLGTNNSLQTSGSFYVFEPFADLPDSKTRVSIKKGIGDMRAVDFDNDGNEELVIGNSGAIGDSAISVFDTVSNEQISTKIINIANQIDRFGYRVPQTTVIENQGTKAYLTIFGSKMFVTPETFDINDAVVLANKYSYNDMWKDQATGKVILASAQSGGSQIHVIDPSKTDWQSKYSELQPQGKIAEMQANYETTVEQLATFERPFRERNPLPVYFLSESRSQTPALIARSESLYPSPEFMAYTTLPNVEDWDRSVVLADNPEYRDKRDGRKNYTLSSQEVLDKLTPGFDIAPGISQWAGHGNDPYMISLPTLQTLIEAGEGKKTVNIYPELEGQGEGFEKVLDDLFYPLAEISSANNSNIYMRNKHAFWQANIYLPEWFGLRSGENSSAFIPAMEETTDKSMEQSLAGRMGIWMSGAVDNWGERYARDNPSFDRLRQHSHQMVPNHALRQIVYKIASGATYINNFSFNQEYMSLVWELVGSGALYVPKREELLSISPVHISMKEPDADYLESGNNVKWTTFYDEETESEPFVFSRLNGTWPGAKTHQWDFSNYAAGTKERRLDFLPKYENGVVMITPVQNGVFKDRATVRGNLTDHMHPIYAGITQQFITDGKQYLTANGLNTFAANSNRYQQIKTRLADKAKLLPMTVTGEAAWVVAQSAQKHLRLTLVDSGYLNPDNRLAQVKFNTVTPVKITDILSGETFTANGDAIAEIPVPLGGFRFIEVEISEVIGDFPAVEDSVLLLGDVTSLPNSSSYSFAVNYTSIEDERAITLNLVRNGVVLATNTVDVDQGTGTVNLELTLAEAPEGGNDYSIEYAIAPKGTTPGSFITIENVVVEPPPVPMDELASVSAPAIIDGNSVLVTVDIDLTEERQLTFDLRDTSTNTRVAQYIATVETPGVIGIEVPIDAAVENGDYRLSVYLTPIGGKFKDRFGDSQRLDVTIERQVGPETGDIDGDGDIDFADVVILSRLLRSGSAVDIRYDFNDDGVVDTLDVRILRTLCTRDRCSTRG